MSIANSGSVGRGKETINDEFDTDEFVGWTDYLLQVVEATGALIYSKKELESEGGVGSVETQLDFSILLIDIVTQAMKIKINRHPGEKRVIGYLLMVSSLLDSLSESAIIANSDNERKEGLIVALDYCNEKMKEVEKMLVAVVKTTDEKVIQEIHNILARDIERWTSKAIDLFTIAEIDSIGD